MIIFHYADVFLNQYASKAFYISALLLVLFAIVLYSFRNRPKFHNLPIILSIPFISIFISLLVITFDFSKELNLSINMPEKVRVSYMFDYLHSAVKEIYLPVSIFVLEIVLGSLCIRNQIKRRLKGMKFRSFQNDLTISNRNFRR